MSDVVVLNADTQVGSAGSLGLPPDYITGGAVKAASEAVRERVLALARSELGKSGAERLEGDAVVSAKGEVIVTLATLLGDEVIEETREFARAAPTARSRNGPGQRPPAVRLCRASSRGRRRHRARGGQGRGARDRQDVGKAINPQAVEGQLEGGAAQGWGWR